MGSYRQLTGQADSPDRPRRVPPILEKVKGPNFPWRGGNTHGVDVPDTSHIDTLEAEHPWVDNDPDIEYMAPENEPVPLIVKVVNDSARERLAWRPRRIRVGDTGIQVLGRHDKRKSVRLKVAFQTDGVDSKPVYIGEDSGVQPYTGYQVDRGEVLFPITSTEEIWAICNPGEQADVFLITEFAVEL